jgi:hypothetical protein
MRCINPLGFGSCAAIKPFLPTNQPPLNQPGVPRMDPFKRRSMILDGFSEN